MPNVFAHAHAQCPMPNWCVRGERALSIGYAHTLESRKTGIIIIRAAENAATHIRRLPFYILFITLNLWHYFFATQRAVFAAM